MSQPRISAGSCPDEFRRVRRGDRDPGPERQARPGTYCDFAGVQAVSCGTGAGARRVCRAPQRGRLAAGPAAGYGNEINASPGPAPPRGRVSRAFRAAPRSRRCRRGRTGAAGDRPGRRACGRRVPIARSRGRSYPSARPSRACSARRARAPRRDQSSSRASLSRSAARPAKGLAPSSPIGAVPGSVKLASSGSTPSACG